MAHWSFLRPHPPGIGPGHNKAAMDAAPSNWHCSRFKEQESILGFRRIRSENSSGSSSFSSRSLRAKRRRKPACTASFPSYDGASVHILAISSFTETDHRLSYSCRTGRAQGSLGYRMSGLCRDYVGICRTVCRYCVVRRDYVGIASGLCRTIVVDGITGCTQRGK